MRPKINTLDEAMIIIAQSLMLRGDVLNTSEP